MITNKNSLWADFFNDTKSSIRKTFYNLKSITSLKVDDWFESKIKRNETSQTELIEEEIGKETKTMFFGKNFKKRRTEANELRCSTKSCFEVTSDFELKPEFEI